MSSGTYYLLCKVFPIPACADTWTEVDDEFVGGAPTAYCDSASCEEEEGGSKAAEARSTNGNGNGYGAV